MWLGAKRAGTGPRNTLGGSGVNGSTWDGQGQDGARELRRLGRWKSELETVGEGLGMVMGQEME